MIKINLSNVKGLLIDIEGTLYFKGKPIPHVSEAIKQMRVKGIPMRFLTNMDSKSISSVQENLASMGLLVATEEILSPVKVALDLFKSHPSKRCYTLLTSELSKEFSSYHAKKGEKVDWVVVGDIRESCSYENFDIAFRHLMEGAELLALQGGRYFVRNNGYHLDTGAFVHLLEYSSEKKARILGKPSKDIFNLGLKELGLNPNEVAVIGDDITTDIIGAKEIGATSILVKTGKYKMQLTDESDYKPDLIIESFPEIQSLIGGIE